MRASASSALHLLLQEQDLLVQLAFAGSDVEGGGHVLHLRFDHRVGTDASSCLVCSRRWCATIAGSYSIKCAVGMYCSFASSTFLTVISSSCAVRSMTDARACFLFASGRDFLDAGAEGVAQFDQDVCDIGREALRRRFVAGGRVCAFEGSEALAALPNFRVRRVDQALQFVDA